MLGRVAVRAARNVPQATLSVRHARVFAHDEFCLHKNCTCHLRRVLGRRGMSATATHDKFTGKHTTLDIKMPDLEEPEENIYAEPPFVPDFWDSKAKTAAAEAETRPSEPPLPKVITAAAESTFPGGGPSSRIYQSSETIKVFKEGGKQTTAETSGVLSNSLSKLSSLANLASSWGRQPASEEFVAKPSAEHEVGDAKRGLNHEEVRGLYVLLGIVGGGWLLGAIFSPKKPQKHH